MSHTTPGAGRRVALFIDGWNLKYAAYDGLGLRIDYTKFLDYLSDGGILIRAYYYIGEWDDRSVEDYLNMGGFTDQESFGREKSRLLNLQAGQQRFYRFLSRNGYRVIRKAIRIRRTRDGRLDTKADLDLELAIDMLTLADRCDRQILVSGDGDFAPLVSALGERGVRTVVVSSQSDEAWVRASFRASDELLDVADEFIELRDIRQHIERPGPAPEATDGPPVIAEEVVTT